MKAYLSKLLKRLTRSQAGFTLAELLVVVGIVVGLAAVILPNVGRFTNKGAEGASATEQSSVQTALDAWASDTANVVFTGVLVGAADHNLLDGTMDATASVNLTGYLRLPNGSTMTTDCYYWDTLGTVSQVLLNTGSCT
ncbi:MAG: prepilin-type N-terminal cleavage/methylation domain-containing protein [Dehalococcoidia bacterium]